MINTVRIQLSPNRIGELYEMVCNKCYHNITDIMPLQSNKRDLKIKAKRNGWVILSDSNTVCPKCKQNIYNKPKRKRTKVITYNIHEGVLT